MDAASPRSDRLGAISMIVGPALMSIGDLFHPAESHVPTTQVAIAAHSAWRWYLAHLLLYVGLLFLVPGLLTLARLARDRRPSAGYAAQVLIVISVGALSAVIVFEMLLGRAMAHGADQTTAVVLLETFQSPAIFVPLVPAMLAFFVGTGLAVSALASTPGPLRWPALCLALGAALIFGEITLAQVLLSQIGNILIFVAGVGFARVLLGSSFVEQRTAI